MDKKTFEALVSKSLESDLRTKELTAIIVRPYWIYYNFFVHLARETNPSLVVELGTSKGAGALSFRVGSPTAEIITVDIGTLSGVSERMKKHNIKRVVDDSAAYAKNVEKESIDILFIDANHVWSYALKDFFTWYPKVKKGGIILLDDVALEGGAKFNPGNIDSHMPLAWECIREWGTAFVIPQLHPSTHFGVVLK